jgi:peptidoglycan/xylan/chitin deacetylase (PgdA/CDA1 family)
MVDKVFNLIGKVLVSNPWFTIRLLKYKEQSIRVVYYHMVRENEAAHYFSKKSISKNLFQQQILFFKTHFTIVSLKNAISMVENGDKKKNLLVLSFDDGFKENFTNVLPILKKNNILATFFIISNCIDNRDLMWRNKLLVINNAEENKLNLAISQTKEEFSLPNFKKRDNLLSWSLNSWKMTDKENIVNFLWNQTMEYSVWDYLEENSPYLNADQINSINDQGHEIGSHSVSHPVFSKLNYFEFREEISSSSKVISELLNIKVNSFSYPFGRTASVEFENRYREESGPHFLFLGTKNSLNNINLNSRWERDNVEHSYNIMLFRFAVLPIFRSLKIY